MQASFNENFKSRNGKPFVVQSFRKKKEQKVSKSQVQTMIKSAVKTRDLLEWKYFSTTVNQANVTFSGTTYALSDVPQGDTDSNRDGDAISLVSLEISLGFYASSQVNACRMIVYQWFPALSSGSPPAPSALLLAVGSALAPFSTHNVDNYQQYKIIFDKTVALSTAEGLRLLNFKIKKFPKRSIQFSGGTTGGSSKLFLLVLSDDGVSSYPLVSYMSKLYYTDA